ncbi:hypothetical protein IW261DRAFT_1425273 [Armillaria novae-zelandiae]|uniref:Uncharacterized protein n=1 Tax=Armillaria novae-zelandiae TaxID=153914 RepID=A0AA39NT39_9AGAR|nr:hypothetical protein IW261DRAFT_1425273 [Armillaria novae-zelandiae]
MPLRLEGGFKHGGPWSAIGNCQPLSTVKIFLMVNNGPRHGWHAGRYNQVEDKRLWQSQSDQLSKSPERRKRCELHGEICGGERKKGGEKGQYIALAFILLGKGVIVASTTPPSEQPRPTVAVPSFPEREFSKHLQSFQPTAIIMDIAHEWRTLWNKMLRKNDDFVVHAIQSTSSLEPEPSRSGCLRCGKATKPTAKLDRRFSDILMLDLDTGVRYGVAKRPVFLKRGPIRNPFSCSLEGQRRNTMRRLVDFILPLPASGEFGPNIEVSLLLQAPVKPSVKLPEGEFAAVVIASRMTKVAFIRKEANI